MRTEGHARARAASSTTCHGIGAPPGEPTRARRRPARPRRRAGPRRARARRGAARRPASCPARAAPPPAGRSPGAAGRQHRAGRMAGRHGVDDVRGHVVVDHDQQVDGPHARAAQRVERPPPAPSVARQPAAAEHDDVGAGRVPADDPGPRARCAAPAARGRRATATSERRRPTRPADRPAPRPDRGRRGGDDEQPARRPPPRRPARRARPAGAAAARPATSLDPAEQEPRRAGAAGRGDRPAEHPATQAGGHAPHHHEPRGRHGEQVGRAATRPGAGRTRPSSSGATPSCAASVTAERLGQPPWPGQRRGDRRRPARRSPAPRPTDSWKPSDRTSSGSTSSSAGDGRARAPAGARSGRPIGDGRDGDSAAIAAAREHRRLERG